MIAYETSFWSIWFLQIVRRNYRHNVSEFLLRYLILRTHFSKDAKMLMTQQRIRINDRNNVIFLGKNRKRGLTSGFVIFLLLLFNDRLLLNALLSFLALLCWILGSPFDVSRFLKFFITPLLSSFSTSGPRNIGNIDTLINIGLLFFLLVVQLTNSVEEWLWLTFWFFLLYMLR